MDPVEDTQSECHAGRSVASAGSAFDTKSEPPCFYYEPVMKRKEREIGGKSVKSSASSSRSVKSSDSRSVISSASNASKLDAKLQSSTRSQNSSSRASKNSLGAKKPSPVNSNTSSSKENLSSKNQNSSKSSSGTTYSHQASSSSSSSSPSSSNRLARAPQSKVNDPPSESSRSSNTREGSITGSHNGLVALYEDPSGDPQTTELVYDRLSTIQSTTGNESDYDDEYDDDQSRDSFTRTSELAAEVERSLVIRRESQSKNSNEVVQYDHKRDNKGGGELVPVKKRYFASAVDNIDAMVPMDSSIYEAYDHTFVTCPEYIRFRFLYTFLRKNLDSKVLIFFSTSDSVRFHAALLKRLRISVLQMHCRQRREKFINNFFKFSDMDTGILCTTDAAGRDLDIPPSVDYVIQFEPPEDPSEYILRIARISCDSDRIGRSILFLNPGEQGFLKYYSSAAISVSEFEVPKLVDIQQQIESLVNENERLLQYAKEAYGSYLISYARHGFRDVYNVHDLNKNDVAAAFGLVSLPGDVEGDEEESTYYAGSSRDVVNSTKGRKTTWLAKQKMSNKTKTWMKGEKLWPHSQIKIHPRFIDNGHVTNEYIYEEDTDE